MITKLMCVSLLVIVSAILLTTERFYPLLNIVYSTLPFISSPSSQLSFGKLFTKSELSKYTGQENAEIYLAVIGDVFDVSVGRKHYGEGGGYHFFTGKDGTRAFVTGDFTDNGLIESTAGLSHSDILGIEEWNEFYKENYKHIGRLIGYFYNENGQPTEALNTYHQQLKEARSNKLSDEDDKQMFPPCNFEYKQGWGRRIWCSTLSGGVTRDWAGVPRQYFQPGKSEPRCACIKNTGPPSGSSNTQSNHGDVDNPLMKVYDGCDEKSFECFFKD